VKKSLSIETIFTEVPFYERFALVRQAGFDHIEFDAWTPLDLTKVADELSRNRLTLTAFAGDSEASLVFPEMRGDFLEFLSQSIAVAKTFGCPNLIVHSNAIAEDGSTFLAGAAYSDTMKTAAAARALLEASRMAEKANLTLLLKAVSTYQHPGAFMSTTAATGDVVRVVDSPNLKIAYDVSQMQMMEGDVHNTVRTYRDFIGYIQVGSMMESPDDSEVNLRAFKKLLVEELKYDGVIGFRFHPGRKKKDCLAAIRDF